MRVNKRKPVPITRTHGGGPASRGLTAEQICERLTLANMLSEDQFYMDGKSTKELLAAALKSVGQEFVETLAYRARTAWKLRHAPLFVALSLIGRKDAKGAGKSIAKVIQRPDELGEIISLYLQREKIDGAKKFTLPNQLKIACGEALRTFDEYQLAKWDGNNSAIGLVDVLNLCRPKPANEEQRQLWGKIVRNELKTPETWETRLSAAGKGLKKEIFEDLIDKNKLGALALIRNLRGMSEAGVPDNTIREALKKCKVDRVLPFRFITAERHAPKFSAELEACMFRCLEGVEKLKGKTILVVDVSGSMSGGISGKSELTRMDAAMALASLAKEICEEPVIYATAGSDSAHMHKTQIAPNRRGFGMMDAIRQLAQSLGGGGIFLKQCLDHIKSKEKSADRIIVFTDEQDCSVGDRSAESADAFGSKGNYIVNVGAYENGIAYRKFMHITGFSENILQFIMLHETLQ